MCHGRHGFRAASDGRYVGQSVQVTLPVDMALDGFQQMSKANPGQNDHRVDLAGDQAVSEIDRGGVVFQRDFAHGRTDQWLAAKFVDHPRDFCRATTLESRHTQPVQADCYDDLVAFRSAKVTPLSPSGCDFGAR